VPVPGLQNKKGKFIEKNINNIFLVLHHCATAEYFFDGLQLWCRAPISGGGVISLMQVHFRATELRDVRFLSVIVVVCNGCIVAKR